MKRANIASFRNSLSEYLSHVKNGDTVRIYDRSTVVADIVPVAFLEKRDLDLRLEELETRGVIHRGRQSLPSSFFNEFASSTKRNNDRSLCELCLLERRRTP